MTTTGEPKPRSRTVSAALDRTPARRSEAKQGKSQRLAAKPLSSELVRHLRGRRSQQAFSRALGFGSNVVYSWESGRRFPEVSVFFRAAERAGIPVRVRLLAFLKEPPAELATARMQSPRTVQRIVQYLAGSAPKRELAHKLGVDRTTVARWLKGTTEPRLPEFLRLVEVTTQRWLEFVELFADPGSLRSTQAAYQDLRAQQKLAYELPWSHALLRALELESYRQHPQHSTAFLSQRVGLSEEDVDTHLRELAHAGQIRWTGHHWELQRVLTVDTRQNAEKNRMLKLHWAQAATARLASGQHAPEALFSFNLFAISEAGFQQVRELHLEYYDRVRAIINESSTADRVVLLNLQLVPLEDPSRP